MERKAFEDFLRKNNIEFYEENEGFIITHKGYVNLYNLKSLPNNIQFNNEGNVNLHNLTSLPNNIQFNNKGYVNLPSLTSLPDNIQFNNNGYVDLTNLLSLPNNIQFNNKGVVYLHNLKSLPDNVQFNNKGPVNLYRLESLPMNKYEIFKNDGIVYYNYGQNKFDPNIEKKPSNSDAHIYLYCKDWYKKNNIIEDLRIICAERCGRYSIKYHDVNNPEEVESCKVSVNDVLIVLTGIVWKYIKEKSYLFTGLINDINPVNTWRVGYLTKECKTMFIEDSIESKESYDYVRAVLYKYKSILKDLTIDDIKKISNQVIGKPDYELFPMFKKEEKIINQKEN